MRQFLWSMALVALVALSRAASILITNDDGFGTSNIRELYRAMKALGHNVYIVAPAENQSGTGGRVVFTRRATLTNDADYGIVKAGAPSIGTDPQDDHIWYYDGTPSAQVFVALDYIFPKHANFTTPDLVLSGPNFGWNMGPFLYALSGTVGATYTAIERGIPAIAISGGYGLQTSYYNVNSSTKAGLEDPATIMGRLAANLAQALIEKAKGGRILPLGYGLSVNIPYITSHTDSSCVNPPFVLTRMTGGANIDKAIFNESSGVFSFENIEPAGVNMCINGDCSLPGESEVLERGCRSSVTVFTVDYDAPYPSSCANVPNPRSLVPDMVQMDNATSLVGGLGANASVTGPPGSTVASSPGLPTGLGSNAVRASIPGVAGVLGLVFYGLWFMI